MPLGDNSDFSILFGPQARARVVAAALRGEKAPPVGDELAQALERSRGAGDLANLLAASGDPAIAQLAQGVRHQAEQDVQSPEQRLRYARDSEQTRQLQDRAERMRDPGSPATALRRTLAKKWVPEVDTSQMTGMDLEPDMPLMERSYAADLRRVAGGGRGKGAGGSGTGTPGGDPISAIADAIVSGKQPPELKGLFKHGPMVRAELARRGFDLSGAMSDWSATQKHLSSLNSQQQTRLRQAVDATGEQVDNVERFYEDWKKAGTTTGLKAFNKASLAASKALGGTAGAAAQVLEGQINLLAGELGNVLMGGNSPTDHALSMAQTLLQGDWDQPTFEAAIKSLRRDIQIRRNSLAHSSAAGTSAGNLYARTDAAAEHAGAPAAPGPGAPVSAAQAAPAGGPKVVERRTINGRTLEKLSDGSIREVK